MLCKFVITWTRKGNVIHSIKYWISTKRDGNLFDIWVSKNRTNILKLKVPRTKLVVCRTINLFTNITYFHIFIFLPFFIFSFFSNFLNRSGYIFCIFYLDLTILGQLVNITYMYDLNFWSGADPEGGFGDLFRIIYLQWDMIRIFFLMGDFIQVNRFSIFFT